MPASVSAGNLWLVPDATGVLHAAAALAVAFADHRAVEEGAQGGRGLDLAGLAAQGVDFGVQRRDGADDRVGGQRAGERGGLGGAPAIEETGQRASRGKLDAGDEGKALLCARGNLKNEFFTASYAAIIKVSANSAQPL
jgi:hypothetical protein